MPESSHRDVNPRVATKPFSNTEATDMSPSMALDSGILSRNDGNGAIMSQPRSTCRGMPETPVNGLIPAYDARKLFSAISLFPLHGIFGQNGWGCCRIN
ncbi:MAG: hypothetical protein WCI11_20755 [Candidatus Methylumidiphilus sp.]